jgi:hypothetical protein
MTKAFFGLFAVRQEKPSASCWLKAASHGNCPFAMANNKGTFYIPRVNKKIIYCHTTRLDFTSGQPL